MVLKIFFSFLIAFFFLFHPAEAGYNNYNDYNSDFQYILTGDLSLVAEQRAWYYIIIDNIEVTSDCGITYCADWTHIWAIYSWTWQLTNYVITASDEYYITSQNIIVKDNFYVYNNSPEVGLIFTINYHYILQDSSIIWLFHYYIVDNDEELHNIISYTLYYVFLLYFLYFSAHKWYKIWSSYFLKK